MTPVEKGRFCEFCQKTVVDFRTATDREIAEAFRRNNNLCGHFRPNQLDRDLVVADSKKGWWVAAATTILAFLGLGTHEIHAQAKVAKPQHVIPLKPAPNPIPPQPAKPEVKPLATLSIAAPLAELQGVLGGAVSGISVEAESKEKPPYTKTSFWDWFK